MFELISVLPDEPTYRAHPAYNQSLLKDWTVKGKRSFRKKYIDKTEKDEPTIEMKLGSLVDARILETEDVFERKFHITSLEKRPTPSVSKFCDVLFDLYNMHLDEGRVFIGDFTELTERAFNISEIGNMKYETFISKFTGGPGEEYFSELLKGIGKTVIAFSDLEAADRAVSRLKNGIATKDIFAAKNKFYQLPIVFSIFGVEFKMLQDIVIVDHENKKVRGFDLKTTFSVEDFAYQYFKMKYFYQRDLYLSGLKIWAENTYPGYEVEDFGFIVVDNLGVYEPQVFFFPYVGHENAWTGFTHKGRYHKGINQIVSEIEYAKANNQWDMSEEVFKNKGVVTYLVD